MLDYSIKAAQEALFNSGYLKEGEDVEGLITRVATAYSNEDLGLEKEVIADHIREGRFFPASPVLINTYTDDKVRGHPISCFVLTCKNSLSEIKRTTSLTAELSSFGGGIGVELDIQEEGSTIVAGQAKGVIPLMKVLEAQGNYYSQGSLRRANSAVYLRIDHPDIMAFLNSRKGEGDPRRRTPDIHIGVVITDEFMEAVYQDKDIQLKTDEGDLGSLVKARDIWEELYLARSEQGEPYVLFIDNVNRASPPEYREHGLKVTTSNLCSEIVLATENSKGEAHGNICCLSSINLVEYVFLSYEERENLIRDVMKFLASVLKRYTDYNTGKHSNHHPYKMAEIEKSVGLGVMGFFEAAAAIGLESDEDLLIFNKEIFHEISEITKKLNHELGSDYPEYCSKLSKDKKLFTHVTAVAPTASISILCGGVSPSIEPFPAPLYTINNKTGSHTVLSNSALREFRAVGIDVDEELLNEIRLLGGEVTKGWCDFYGLNWLAFRSAMQTPLDLQIQLMVDRAKYIDQAISNNLFVSRENLTKKEFTKYMFAAWRGGVKSLYYSRAEPKKRAAHMFKAEEDCKACS